MLRATADGILLPECDDGGVCSDMFILDTGVRYEMLCTTVRASAVGGDVLGRGAFYGQVTVNAIDSFPADIVVAVSGPGQELCSEPPDGVWWLGYSLGAPLEIIEKAICTVGELSDSERQAQDC
jgi:hypothetical protein